MLLVVFAVLCEAADFGVTVFDLTAGTRDHEESLRSHIRILAVGSGFVVSFLVDTRVVLVGIADYVVFKFAEALVVHAGLFLEG